MTRAFVAGATGYTGRSVVEALRARGVDTVAHVRPDSSSRREWQDRFESLGARVDVTPWEPEATQATLRVLAPTLVFALLGTTRARARREAGAGGEVPTYESVDLGLTLMLLEAARASGAGPGFVYLSSVGVSESTRNPYLAVRARVEAALRAGPLRYLIVRPSFITGPDRDESRPAERIGALVGDVLLGVAGLIGARRLRDRYRSMTGARLARAMVALALEPDGWNRVVEGDVLRRAG